MRLDNRAQVNCARYNHNWAKSPGPLKITRRVNPIRVEHPTKWVRRLF